MQHTPDLTTPDAADALSKLTEEASGLGKETVDISGFLEDLDARCHRQLSELQSIDSHSASLSRASARMTDAVEAMTRLADGALDKVRASASTISDTGQSSQALAEWVRSVNADSHAVEEMLMGVKNSNTLISDIAWQVHILAINAKIEAARAGPAGKGFSIVADSVKDLSQKTSEAAETITETVSQLSAWMAQLHRGAQQTAQQAERVITQSAETDEALSDIEKGISQLRQDTHGLSEDATKVRSAAQTTSTAVADISASVASVTEGVDEATRRCYRLIDTSESILQHSVALGGSGDDSAMITRVQDLAGQVIQAIETELTEGRISEAQLFSEDYAPIPGSDPEQVMTPFTEMTDRILPAIQEPALTLGDHIVFCAAVDRNGYLPTHNLKFSQPQGDDPTWNAANCRNRRIFDDRVGLKAGRNQRPFLLQVYRRDMGGGTFVMMKDLSAPITIRGRHWGGLRLAYKF